MILKERTIHEVLFLGVPKLGLRFRSKKFLKFNGFRVMVNLKLLKEAQKKISYRH